MGQALYRKYRSKKLSEIVGQEHITHTLEQALKSGRISHAYLFTGPRGVGKTSIARILAHEINQLPYTDDQTDIDIIEIDAASNRRIDEIRDLRDKVYIAPTSAKFKVYIIDEVHMLTKEAFNALLKTLEEPPAHVVFILATTESHKLPETIVSRTQQFIFKPIELTKAVAHLREIAGKENIEVTDEALELIAKHADGSFRDSIGLLDQAAGRGTKVDADAIQSILGIPSTEAIKSLLTQIQQNASVADILTALNTLYEQGFQAAAIAKQLAGLLRTQLINQSYPSSTDTATALLIKLLEVPVSHDPERYLEIVLLQSLETSTHVVAPQVSSPPVEHKPAVTPKPAVSKSIKEKAIEAAPVKEPTSEPIQSKPPIAGAFDQAAWTQVIQALKKQYNTLYSVVRMAEPRFLEDGTLELVFAFAFHQKRVNEAKNRTIISNAIVATTGQHVEIICSVDPDLKSVKSATEKVTLPDVPAANDSATEPLSAISNIFGGGELLES